MFERFDDPVDFRPGASFRDGVRRRGEVLRRRRRRAVAGMSAVVVAVGAMGAGAIYVDRRDDAIDRVTVATQPSTDGSTNILLVGTDAGVSNGARADSIAVLRLDETGTRLLAVPRDLYDEQAGTRINGTFLEGDAQALIDSVERTTGIPIQHYIALEPQGFVDLVDTVGGLRIEVTDPIVDPPTGLALEPGGCVTLDGATALALARARHVDAAGDLGRVARQQVMLGAALDQLDPGWLTIDQLSRVLADHAVVDDGLDLATLVSFGNRIADGPPLVTELLPVVPDTLPNGAAVLRLAPEAGAVAAGYGAPEGARQPGGGEVEPVAPPTSGLARCP